MAKKLRDKLTGITFTLLPIPTKSVGSALKQFSTLVGIVLSDDGNIFATVGV